MGEMVQVATMCWHLNLLFGTRQSLRFGLEGSGSDFVETWQQYLAIRRLLSSFPPVVQ